MPDPQTPPAGAEPPEPPTVDQLRQSRREWRGAIPDQPEEGSIDELRKQRQEEQEPG